MTSVNWRRVWMGGMLAALVMSIAWLPVVLIFRAEAIATLGAMGLSDRVTVPMMAYVIVVTPGLGILSVWIYAAIRPRYGPGPRTAVIAGLAVWTLSLLTDGAWYALGIVPIGSFGFLKALDLVAVVLATLAGARVYRDGPLPR